MRIILREYLGMLKESGEFDAVMPDLLREMGIVPLSSPQVGVRQAGVDLAGVGPDEGGTLTVWLLVLKRGDIGRKDWDTQPQSIRPSLEEIRDMYIPNNIAPEHKGLPVKIVVATTGDFKQEIQQNLAGYAKRYEQRGLGYAFWNGDTVAALMEEHLLSEHAFPASAQSHLRRALALIAEPDYDLGHYFALLRELLQSGEDTDAGRKKRLVRSITTVHLALAILRHWAAEDGNLRNAMIASERTLLWIWDAVRKAGLTGDGDVFEAYLRIVTTHVNLGIEYFNKVQPHLHTPNAIARYFRESAVYTERLFEEIGFIGTIGLTTFLFSLASKNAERVESTKAIAETLHALIKTHPMAGSPCYDNQCIEISLGLLLFSFTDRAEAAKEWLSDLSGRLAYAYSVGKWFPVSTDAFDDLVALELDRNDVDIAKLKEMSWLIPTLAQWCAVLGADEAYKRLAALRKDAMKETCFQLWYPDAKTDEVAYDRIAHFDSGISDAPMELPDTAEEMREQIRRTRTDSPVKEQVKTSAITAGLPFLDFIACRHFKTPVDPAYWQRQFTERATAPA